ncbi:hypothetical protein BO82DRAFT_75472 [Aspergillus uvarum CBS 121591]|uniref:Uncharacterized protein n=1 Tax=Aspergillus uvarum CBS 121591 TaxID=1448315 RepID=A0A319DRL7_9EURO|nr:hypothetical protein BO82DRAFT_75472 [Aspergillus uvarum CBS 121591]PYH81852.1 hypothetical protein BO82DRAFT_75472 [Aspergillus uvarum CBS 121591]
MACRIRCLAFEKPVESPDVSSPIISKRDTASFAERSSCSRLTRIRVGQGIHAVYLESRDVRKQAKGSRRQCIYSSDRLQSRCKRNHQAGQIRTSRIAYRANQRGPLPLRSKSSWIQMMQFVSHTGERHMPLSFALLASVRPNPLLEPVICQGDGND